MEKSQIDGCGCGANHNLSGEIVLTPRPLTKNQMDLVNLIKSVQDRKSKLAKNKLPNIL
jgi:hypothetical protein